MSIIWNPSRFLIPIIALGAAVALVVWLAQGSSNQPRQSAWQEGWSPAASFKMPRRAPAAVTHNGYLYIVGGIDEHDYYVKPVEYAPILADGSLGPWRNTSALLDGRFYNSAIAVDGYLYTLGGGSGPTGAANYPITTVERAEIMADGSLGPWQYSSELTTARRGLKAVLYGKTLYAIGGYDGRFLKSIERAVINEQGELSDWQLEEHESVIDRYIHASAIDGTTLYLLGGHMYDPQQTSYGDVETSRIRADNSLSPWQIEAKPLQIPRLVAESFVLNGYLYIAGGHTGSERLTSVETSRLGPDGSVGEWQQTTALPTPRSAFAVATAPPYVYVLGGAGEQGPLTSVHYARSGAFGRLIH